ncbi:MAG: protein kinase [Verrucomicrobiota bacterium]
MSEALTFQELAPNATLGHYTLVEHIADGGMGHVFRAYEPSLQRDVAIKVLKAEFVQDEEILKQFEMEAQNIAALRHPNIVPIYYVGHQGELYFFAMPFIVGQTLDLWVDGEDIMSLDEGKWVMYQAADALERALAHNIVHLDIKPSNFLVDESGAILLTDFGLAKMLGQNVDPNSEDAFCTPAYMCPEQILRKPTDQRSDIYCLGATMFHLVTGNFLFDTDSIAELVKAHLHEPFPFERATSYGLPPGWIHLLSKMVQKDPENRYQDYGELRAAIDNVDHLSPVNLMTQSEEEDEPTAPIPVPVLKSSPETLHGILGKRNMQWAEGSVERTITKPRDEVDSKIGRGVLLKIDENIAELKEVAASISTDMADLAEAVALVPVADEYIQQLGTSELISGIKEVETRRQAIRQVGLNLSGQILLTEILVENMAKQEEDFVWKTYWQQAIATGVVAHVLCRLLKGSYVPGKGKVEVKKKTGLTAAFKKSSFEKAEVSLFAAALCHGIGKIVLSEIAAYPYFVALYQAQENNKPLAEIEQNIFTYDHHEVGAKWLKAKGFDPGIRNAALYYNSPSHTEEVQSSLICVASHVVRLFGLGYGGDPVLNVRDVWRTPAWTSLITEADMITLTPAYMEQEFIPLVGTLPNFEY